MINFSWHTFDALTTTQLYDILSLRQNVFIIEQNCIYPDLDYNDQQALHLLATKDNRLIAYLRFFPKGTLYLNEASFGRLITHSNHQKIGLGRLMMKKLFDFFILTYPKDTMLINAQCYLQSFYESFGFRTIGDAYDDAGIMHIDMEWGTKMNRIIETDYSSSK